MSTTTTFSFDSINPALPVRRFTVEEYHRLGESGVLKPDDRVELLEGWIIEKMNHRPAHGYAVGTLNQWLVTRLPDGWIGRCQLPITLSKSEPEPDIAIVKGAHADFRNRHPSGSDCRLVIEVADTSISRDRSKATIYASVKIEEYWIVNLADQTLEKMAQPVDSAYSQTEIMSAGNTVEIKLEQSTLKLPRTELFEQ